MENFLKENLNKVNFVRKRISEKKGKGKRKKLRERRFFFLLVL